MQELLAFGKVWTVRVLSRFTEVLSVYAVVQCIRQRRRVRRTTSNPAQPQADRRLWHDSESGRGESHLSHRRSTSVCTHSLHV